MHEKALIEGCRKNDRKAQEELYRFFYTDMLRIAMRYKRNQEDAASLVNEVFFRAFTKIESYRDEMPFKAWLARITHNLVIDEFRRDEKKLKNEMAVDWSEPIHQGDLTQQLYRDAEDRLSGKDLLKMINDLESGPRMVFNLFEIEGYQHKEIAEQLGVSERTCKRYLAEAREILKERVKKLLSPIKTSHL